MLYIKVTRMAKDSRVVLSASVADQATVDHARRHDSQGIETRNDWHTFDAAKAVATALGKEYIATDAGEFVSPQYDVQRMWKIGDKVSYAFNGDSYPCGVIVKVSKSLRCITTDGGRVFYRIRQSGSWRADGTWFLSPGHVDKRNPEF